MSKHDKLEPGFEFESEPEYREVAADAFVYEDNEPDRCCWRAVLRRRYKAGAKPSRASA